jgi:hypothetical protein
MYIYIYANNNSLGYKQLQYYYSSDPQLALMRWQATRTTHLSNMTSRAGEFELLVADMIICSLW